MSTEIRPYQSQAERIERFQSLEAGSYWRALKNFDNKGIEANEVLLVELIKYVDGEQHTVMVRSHPGKIGKSFSYVSEDGRKRYETHGVHGFIVEDFLLNFEFEPEAESIRNDEVAMIQGQVAELQQQIVQAQVDPTILAAVVQEELAKKEEERVRNSIKIEAPKNEGNSTAVATMEVTPKVLFGEAALEDIIQVGMNSKDVENMQRVAETHQQIALIKANYITSITSNISKTLQSMMPYIEEKGAAALARTADVRSHVEKISKGIKTLDLYVGTDIIIQKIVSGESASETEPLTLYQKKLIMDQELAVYTDVDEWFDFTDHDKFVVAVNNNPGLIEQMMPAKRSIAIMCTTNRYIDYGDAYETALKRIENLKVFLLVRDGGNLYRVVSPIETHLAASMLFPSEVEMNKVFTDYFGQSFTLKDVGYADRKDAYDAAALHYKRFIIMLAGLDHREKLFGKFYPGEASMDFISVEFQKKYMKFIFDESGNTTISGTRNQYVGSWLAEKNAAVTKNSRLFCDFEAMMNEVSAPGAFSSYEGVHRTQWEQRYHPVVKFGVEKANKSGDEIIVTVPVSGFSYSLGKNRQFNCKISITKFLDEMQERFGFICIDNVTPDELRYYINDRSSRKDHIRYIRLFKMALKIVEAELMQEAPMRRKMRQALDDANIGREVDRDKVVHKAVVAYRAANKGKPLPSVNALENKDWTYLLNIMHASSGSAAQQVSAVEAEIIKKEMMPLRIAVTGKGEYVAYAAVGEGERDNRIEEFPFVKHMHFAFKNGIATISNEEFVLMPFENNAETVLKEFDEAKNWIGKKSVFKSYKQRNSLLSQISEWKDVAEYWTKVPQDKVLERLTEWEDMRDDFIKDKTMVDKDTINIPFGLAVKNDGLKIVYLTINAPIALILKNATSVQMDYAKNIFSQVYKNRRSALKIFDEQMAGSYYSISIAKADDARDLMDGSHFDMLTAGTKLSPQLLYRHNEYMQSSYSKLPFLGFGKDLESLENIGIDEFLGLEMFPDARNITVRRSVVSLGDKKLMMIDVYDANRESDYREFYKQYGKEVSAGWSKTVYRESEVMAAAQSLAGGFTISDEKIEVPSIRPEPEWVKRYWAVE